MIYFITAWMIEKWFKNHRTEFDRLKNEMKCKKSGQAPKHWLHKKKWRWEAWKFLWDDIVLRNYAEDTMVGIHMHLK